MRPRPTVLIPAGSPLLEPVARAIAAGLPGRRKASGGITVVASSSAVDIATNLGPIVFVGWQGDLEPSRGLASDILAALAQSRSGACSVALFESSPSDERTGVGEPIASCPKDCHGLRFLGPAERFVVTHDLRMEDPRQSELARARRWAARVYADWQETPTPPVRTVTVRGTEAEPPAWTSWCGALE